MIILIALAVYFISALFCIMVAKHSLDFYEKRTTLDMSLVPLLNTLYMIYGIFAGIGMICQMILDKTGVISGFLKLYSKLETFVGL